MKKYLKGFWVALLLAIVGIAGVQEPEAVQATVNGKGVVELNTEVRGTLVEGDVDIYAFQTPDEEGYFSSKFTNLGDSSFGGMYFSLSTDIDAIELFGTAGASARDVKSSYYGKLEPNTMYFYVIKGEYGNCGDYKFTISYTKDDYKDTVDSAKAISLNKVVKGVNEYTSDVDVFSFKTLKEEAFYSLEASVTSEAGTSVVYTIYSDADLIEKVAQIQPIGKTTLVKDLDKLTPDTTYYLTTNSPWNNKGEAYTYQFKLVAVKDDAGDESSNAATIKLNESKTYGIQDVHDVDYFEVKTGAFTSYKLTFANVKCEGAVSLEMFSGAECLSDQKLSTSSYLYKGRSDNKTISLEANKTYYIRVKGNSIGTYKLGLIANPPASFSVKNSSTKDSNQVKVSWKKLGTASGYEVYRSTEKNGEYEKIATISKVGTTSYVDKSVSKGKTYYYKIRAIKKSGKKTDYTNFTAVKSVKIK